MKSTIIGAFLLLSVAGIWAQEELSDIELLRQNLLKLDADHVDDLKRFEYHVKLMKLYKTYGDTVDKQFPLHEILKNENALNNSLSSLYYWAKTWNELKIINGMYGEFRRMQIKLTDEHYSPTDNSWFENFAGTVMNDATNSITGALDRVANYVERYNLFDSAYQATSLGHCDVEQSQQQLIYNLYMAIALTEIKGYAMVQFSTTLYRIYSFGNYSEAKLWKDQYSEKPSLIAKRAKETLTTASRDIWKCDPRVHKAESTFTELKQVFQGYIVNEVDLNSMATCRENCGFYSVANVYGCFKNQFCARQKRCNGKIVHCTYVDADMWICPSEGASSRRYEYIEYEDGQTFGQKGTCKRGETKVDSWWRWLFWHCSYCFCYCDDHTTNSERYFNLRSVTSDIDKNKVVTGIRFKKENKIVHIQIQEGKLLPRGKIDASTVAWKPIDNYTILDENVRNGEDYHTIMWEKRALDLDDLTAPLDHLLTGVKFKLLGGHLNLEIQATPFNYTTGVLMKEKSRWYANDNTEAHEVYDVHGGISERMKRTELKLLHPDIPNRSKFTAVPDSKSNQYLYFGPTDLHKDAAQTTIPFIDIQPVEPNPHVPLSGAGVFHKGTSGYGGYVALKLITYDYTPHTHVSKFPNSPTSGFNNEINSI